VEMAGVAVAGEMALPGTRLSWIRALRRRVVEAGGRSDLHDAAEIEHNDPLADGPIAGAQELDLFFGSPLSRACSCLRFGQRSNEKSAPIDKLLISRSRLYDHQRSRFCRQES
jgi:hypothetical protein